MHIVIVGPFPPYRGGIAHLNERMAHYLHEAGHRVTAVNFRYQYPGFLFPGTSQEESDTGGTALPYETVRLIHTLNPFSWFTTARYINRLKPDVVLFRFWLPFMAPALGTIARLLSGNIRTVALTDNVIPHEKRPGDRIFTNWFLKPVHAFVTLSDAVAEDLNTFDQHKPRLTLFHPVYDQFGEGMSKSRAREQLGLDPKDRIMLFFGFIRGYKGLDLALKALRMDYLERLNVKLLIAGEYYEDKSTYQPLIDALGDRVIEHDHFIPSDQVAAYFCAADCVIQPYKTATQSGVTQIAYHFGRPMIVTRVSGLPELVPHGVCGYVVPPDADSLAEAIVRFYEGNKADIFSTNVLARKKHYSWQAFVEKLTNWMEGLGK